MLRISILLLSFCPLQADILVSTFAGGAIPSGVPAQQVYLATIAGTAWDSAGNLVFCDSANHVLRRVRTDGTIETIAGTGVSGYSGDGGAASQALLNYPEQPRYDAAGNLYFYDSGNRRIRRIDTNGIVTTIAGNGIPFAAGMDLEGPAAVISLDSVLDLAVDSSGNVYFSELARILRVTPAGNVQVYGGTGAPSCYLGCTPTTTNGDGGPATAAQMSPSWLATDGAGNLFFVDGSLAQITPAQSIRRISTDGTVTTFVPAPSPLSSSGFSIASLAADQSGNVYAVEGSIIMRYAPDGTGVAIAGANGSPSPSSLAVDSKGDLGFANEVIMPASSSYSEIQEITAQGNTTTLAGGSPTSPPDGTPLLNAWFSPSAIAVSQSGDLYIADNQDCRIRKISADGVLSTFAGTGTCGTAFAPPSGNAKMANLFFPLDLAVDSQNNVWVIDFFLDVYSIAQDGTIALFPSKPPVTILPDQIAIDSQGRAYCESPGSLVRFLPDGTLQTIVAAPTIAGVQLDVNSIGTDTQGNVYFGAASEIYRVNDDGTYTLVSQTGNGGGHLAVDAAGNFWFASAGEFEVTGTNGTPILGSSQTGFSGDRGPAQDASFSSLTLPTAFAPNGDLYFIDGSRIRALSFTGTTPATPVISSGGIVNSANYTGGALAPGELISIFGSNFGATALQTNAPVNNSLSSSLGRTKVLFNSIAGATAAVTPNQLTSSFRISLRARAP